MFSTKACSSHIFVVLHEKLTSGAHRLAYFVGQHKHLVVVLVEIEQHGCDHGLDGLERVDETRVVEN